MRSFSQFSPKVLAVLAALFLAGSLWVVIRYVRFDLRDPSITVAAIMATVAGLFLTAGRQISDRQESVSRFYLDQYLAGFDKAYKILDAAVEGDNSIRLKWIAAARVLATAREFMNRVTIEAHRDVARMSIPDQSQRFEQFFRKPGWYYYGVRGTGNQSEQETMDDAAKKSTAASGSTVSTVLSVEEKVIQTVWSAVAYPADYEDPIGEKFSAHDRLFLPHGLRRYLDHRDQWASAAGNLYPRKPGETAG